MRPLPSFLDPGQPAPNIPAPVPGTPAPGGYTPSTGPGISGGGLLAYLANLRNPDPNYVGPTTLTKAQQIAAQGARRRAMGLGRQPGAPAVPQVPNAGLAGSTPAPAFAPAPSGGGEFPMLTALLGGGPASGISSPRQVSIPAVPGGLY
jgi:hypothetical protein